MQRPFYAFGVAVRKAADASSSEDDFYRRVVRSHLAIGIQPPNGVSFVRQVAAQRFSQPAGK